MNLAGCGRRAIAGSLLLLAVVLSFDASAALRTWTGTTSGSWILAANWGGTAPVAGDDLVFPVGAGNKANNNDFPTATSFNSIAINDVGYTLGGNAATLAAANALTVAATSAGSVAVNIPLTFTNGSATITHIGVTSISQTVTLGPLTVAGGSLAFNVTGNLATVDVQGAIGESSPAQLLKNGDGLLSLYGANSYTGTTTVAQGYLYAANSSALGAGTNSAADGTVVNNGGSLGLVGTINIANERIVLNGVGQSGNGALQSSGGGVKTLGGDVVLNGPNIAFNLVGGAVVINGRVTGSGDLAFGRDTLTLSNTGNDYAGSTTIGNPVGGVSTLLLGASNVIPDTSAISILDSGILDLNFNFETAAALSGTSLSRINVRNGRLTFGGNNSSTAFDGQLDSTLGSGNLYKTGTGAITFSAQSNSYTGSIIFDNGIVAFLGSGGIPNGFVNPIGGVLAGSGSGPIGSIYTNVTGFGTIAPGPVVGGPGSIVSTGAISLVTPNQYFVQLNGTTAGTTYDQITGNSIALGGILALGATLSVTVGYIPTIGDTYRIINNVGGQAVFGNFAGLPQNAALAVSGQAFRISYTGGDGNDVVLTALGPTSTPSITTPSPLPSGTVGVSYPPVTLAATGGITPYTWAITAGALPTNMGINSATGTIGGTPFVSGTFNFTVTVTDAVGATASKAFVLTIAPAPPAVSITTASSLPGGAAGAAYSTSLAATGGSPPYTWAVTAGALPAGLLLNASTGVISGTATAAGTFNFTVTATDALSATGSKAFTLAISPSVAPQAIPTLGPLAMLLLSALLGFLGMRRRR